MTIIEKNMFNLYETAKVYFIASSGIVVSFTVINDVLKFALLVATFIYTSYKVYRMVIDDAERRKDKQLNEWRKKLEIHNIKKQLENERREKNDEETKA